MWRKLAQFEKVNYSKLQQRNSLVDLPPPPVDDEPEAKPVVEPENTKPLVPIVVSKIGEHEVNSVSARELYLDLGMDEKHWSRWQRRNIEENRFFSQGIDYIEITRRATPDIPNPPKDYAVTINTAKHIAMMAKTKRAHDYRNYFIECEKVAKGEIPKVEPKPESNLIENFKKASELIDLTIGMLAKLGIEGNQAALELQHLQHPKRSVNDSFTTISTSIATV